MAKKTAAPRAPERLFDDADIRAALWQAGGVLAEAARIISKKIGRPVSRSTISRAVSKSTLLQEVHQRVFETKVDYLETAFWRKVEAGETASIHFGLSTLGRARGYVRRDEITTPPGQPLQVQTTLDLSKLSQDELRIMHALATRARGGRLSPLDEDLVKRGLIPPPTPREAPP